MDPKNSKCGGGLHGSLRLTDCVTLDDSFFLSQSAFKSAKSTRLQSLSRSLCKVTYLFTQLSGDFIGSPGKSPEMSPPMHLHSLSILSAPEATVHIYFKVHRVELPRKRSPFRTGTSYCSPVLGTQLSNRWKGTN